MSINWKRLLAKKAKREWHLSMEPFTIVKPDHLTEEEWRAQLEKFVLAQKKSWRMPIMCSDDVEGVVLIPPTKLSPMVPLPKLFPPDKMDALTYSLRYAPITISAPTVVASMLAEEKEDKEDA